jgi:HAE1 family hydrophobic/amphiphilic exporter-1
MTAPASGGQNPPPSGSPELWRPTSQNPLHMVHRWSIEHPYVIVAFYVAVIALAWIAVTRVLPRRFAPYVESPMIGIVTMMPGLSAREMELYISKPIEEQLINIKGLRFIRSTSQEGLSIVTLEFNYGQDIRRATFDVQSLMNVVQSNLPATGANLKPSWVVPIDPLNLPVVTLALRGDPAQGWDMPRVREFADNTVVDRLKAIPTVYSVVPFGGYRRQVQVVADREKLAAHRLSLLSIRDAIDRYNVSRPAGSLTRGPSETAVRVDNLARSAADIQDYPIAAIFPGSAGAVPLKGRAAESQPSGPMGGMGTMGETSAGAPSGMTQGPSAGERESARLVRVRDVATVVDTYWERRSGYRYLNREGGGDGEFHSAIAISVIQDPGASSASVVPEVMRVVRALERENPGVTFETAYDNAYFVERLFANVWHELLLAIGLAGLAILFFLGEWRGTLIALITLPTSLAMAILMMLPFGMTFNSGTLIGLLLCIGRLVDDSIIDIHAVERHLRMGKDPKSATVDGIAEVRLAVISTTVMMVLALTPLLFSGGITEMMFRELVWPLIFGLLGSMLVSFTLTALLCAKLLRPEKEREADRKHWLLRWLYVPLDPVQRGLDRMEQRYEMLIRWLLRHRFANLTRVAATVMLGFGFYYFIGSEMMPLADVGQASGVMEMEPGVSFAETEKAARQLERILLKHPEIERVSMELGAESMFESWSPYYTGYQMPQINAASMMLTFSDKDTRRKTIWQVMDAVHAEAYRTIPRLRRLQLKEMGSDVMATAAAPIHVNIYGPDLEVLDRLGSEVLNVARRMPDLFQPATTWTLSAPEYRVRVNSARAAELGLSPDAIAQQAYYALRGGLATEFFRLPDLRQTTVLIRYEEEDRRNRSDLEGLYITAADGSQVPLKSVATLERAEGPTAIERDGLKRVLGVTGYYRLGFLPSMDVVMELVTKAYGGDPERGIEPVNFPPGYGLEMRGDMTQMMDSFRRLLYGLAIALVFMYLVLVMQFRGFVQPLQMIASLPLELAGVFAALWLAHAAFSTVSILGIIVLTGMDITTAVLMIDMIARYRDRGVPRDEAVARACPQRLRPVLMTSGITLIVLLPIAIAPRTGLDAYQPLAVAVVGGLIMGTLLSLIDIPIMHTVVDDVVQWFHRTFLGREWQWPVTQPADQNAPD